MGVGREAKHGRSEAALQERLALTRGWHLCIAVDGSSRIRQDRRLCFSGGRPMLVYLVVLVCAVLLGWMVYRYDMYEKEPWYLLLVVMILGGVFMWGVGYLEDFSNARLGFDQPDVQTAGQAAVAASHEELAKLLVVALVALLFRRHFNDPMDGLILGAFAGLGMAVHESLLYLDVSLSEPLAEPRIDLVGRELVRLVLHILMGGITGFGVGLAVEHSRLPLWFAVLAGWLAAAMMIHFLWDYLCGIPAVLQDESGATSQTEVFRRGSAVLLMLTAMAFFGFSVVLGSRLSRKRFDPTSEKRLSRWSLFH